LKRVGRLKTANAIEISSTRANVTVAAGGSAGSNSADGLKNYDANRITMDMAIFSPMT
jgi:hypothetical protein